MFGNYYVYDAIAPIADVLKKSLSFTDQDIGSLYSMYSIAAVIVLIIGGVIIDRIGTGKATVLFGAICTAAGIVNALSSDVTVMIGARFMLGVGAEPLIVAITTALAKWFKGKELSFAFGVNLTISRMGQIAADWSPTWAPFAYRREGKDGKLTDSWQGPLVLAAVIGVLCVVTSVIYAAMESYASRNYDLGAAEETEKLVWKDLFRFDRSFWLVVMLCVTFYSAIFPFRSFAIKYFIEAWEMTRKAAGGVNSVLPLAGMVATPLFGLLVDKLGKRSLFMVLGAFLLMPVYVMMAYKVAPLSVPIGMMGVAFSLIPAVMWPSVAYIVEQKRLGTGYSVMTLVQQLGVAGMNWGIGFTNDVFGASKKKPAGYIPGLWIFSTLGFFALLFACLLRVRETGPKAHGLETITTKTNAGGEPAKDGDTSE
ncbi:MAG: MFS transporter [Proteobacteria bacterium]|nr:MAG: MFS transporter [Pseudomonadota bacterium]